MTSVLPGTMHLLEKHNKLIQYSLLNHKGVATSLTEASMSLLTWLEI